MSMSLQAKLDEVRADLAARIPAEALKMSQQVVDELVASGVAEEAVMAGDLAPSFTLPDTEGRLVRSSQLLERGPVVVFFYRGIWCPYSGLELGALQGAVGEIRARGAVLVAISQQTIRYSRKAQRDFRMSFPLLVDKGGEVTAAFGLRWMVPSHLRTIFTQIGANLDLINGDTTWTLPLPSRYVIRSDGIVAYMEVGPDYSHRPDPSELFPILENLSRLGRSKRSKYTG
jgi:peroxiredoxin